MKWRKSRAVSRQPLELIFQMPEQQPNADSELGKQILVLETTPRRNHPPRNNAWDLQKDIWKEKPSAELRTEHNFMNLCDFPNCKCLIAVILIYSSFRILLPLRRLHKSPTTWSCLSSESHRTSMGAVLVSSVRLSVAPWTAAHQAPLSMEFSRQEYGSGLSFPSPVIGLL